MLDEKDFVLKLKVLRDKAEMYQKDPSLFLGVGQVQQEQQSILDEINQGLEREYKASETKTRKNHISGNAVLGWTKEQVVSHKIQITPIRKTGFSQVHKNEIAKTYLKVVIETLEEYNKDILVNKTIKDLTVQIGGEGKGKHTNRFGESIFAMTRGWFICNGQTRDAVRSLLHKSNV